MATTPTDLRQHGELIPEQGAPDVGKKVFEYLGYILKDKDSLGIPSKVKRNYELIANKFWKQDSATLPLATANLLFTHLQRVVNQLTDNNPTFNVIPEGDVGPEYDEALYRVQNTIEYWWNETEQQAKYAVTVKNGEMNGTAIEKWYFDPNKKHGMGEVDTDNVDILHFGVWPLDAKRIEDCEMVFHYRPYQVGEVKRIWGEKAAKVVADEDILSQLGDDRRTVVIGKTDSGPHLATISSAVKTLLAANKTVNDVKDQVLVVECWVKDYSTVTEERIVESGNQDGEDYIVKETVKKPKYTGEIRRIITCNMGDVVLEDRDNPSINPSLPEDLKMSLFLYDRFPFGVAQSLLDTVSIWGRTDLDQLIPIQTEINKTLTAIMHFKDKSARPKVILPQDTGIHESEITNTTGVLRPVNSIAGQGIRWLPGPEAQLDLMQTLETLKAWFFLIAGTFEMDQANLAGNDVVAYKAINALLERAAAMQKGKERNYSRLIRDRGRAWLSLAQAWYTEDRWVPIEQDGKKKPVKIAPEQLRLPMTISVISGSTLPISNVQRREEALMLFNARAIDHQELLKRLEWPDYMDVVNRLNAGPLGEMVQRAIKAGMPEPVAKYIQELAQMKPDRFENAVKRGEIPDFMSVMQQAITGQPPQNPAEQAELMKAQAEVEEKKANAQKAAAEVQKIQMEALERRAAAMLAAERVASERFDREVKAEGVKMDWKKLDQESAIIASDIEVKQKQMEHDAARIVGEIEQGMRKAEVDMKTIEVTKDAKRNEQGLKSNNKE